MESGPAEIIMLGMLRVLRRAHTPHWCRKRLVGPMREMLRQPISPEQIAAIRPGLEEARATAERLLLAECRKCAGCRLGRG